MRTIETVVFQYDELSESAKAKARDWYREASAGDTYFAEAVTEDFQRVADCMGIAIKSRVERWHITGTGKSGETVKPCIYWSGFCCQGDGASFEGQFTGKPGNVERVKAYAPRDGALHKIADRIDAAVTKAGFEIVATISQSGRYYHARTMSAEIESADLDAAQVEIAAELEAELRDCFRALADWLYGQLESENDQVNSDEHVSETIKANEYEFTAEGKRYV